MYIVIHNITYARNSLTIFLNKKQNDDKLKPKLKKDTDEVCGACYL